MYRAKFAPTLPYPRASGAKSPRPFCDLEYCQSGEHAEGQMRRQAKRGTFVAPCNPCNPTLCGIVGKVYSPHDCVGPICDSIDRLYDTVYGSGMARLVHREERRRIRNLTDSGQSPFVNETSAFEGMVIDQYSTNIVRKPKPLKPGELCINCRTTNQGSQRVDSRTGYLVCEECGAEGKRYIYGTDYKETKDTETSTARADHPVSERHDPNFATVAQAGTVVPYGAKKKNKIDFAQALVNNETEHKETKLSRGNKRKLTAIIELIDGFLTELASVETAISRRVRMDVSAAFCAAVAHREKCKKKECQKSLVEKPARVIAREGFCYSIDQLSAGAGIEGVSKQKIVLLQERVQSSLAFSHRENATQHQSCRAMIAAILTGDNLVECSSVDDEDSLKTQTKSTPSFLSKGMSFERQNSDVQSSLLMQIRDQISRLSIVYNFSSQVQSAALSALQDGSFSKSITDHQIANSTKFKEASAYMLLHSIAEEMGTACSDPSEEHLLQVGLEGVDVRIIMDRMRSMLPKTAIGTTFTDDDELY